MITLEFTAHEKHVDPASSASAAIRFSDTPLGIDEALTLELVCPDPHCSSTATARVRILEILTSKTLARFVIYQMSAIANYQ